MQTITELWNGNIAPVEHCGAGDTAANRLHSQMEKAAEDLSRGLTDGQKEAFDKYAEYSEDYLLRMMELAFTDGFSLGASLTMEALA